MSLVGPRPALPHETARYGDDMQRRLKVQPGITGLWQVSGRSDLPWDEAVRLDIRYVENWAGCVGPADPVEDPVRRVIHWFGCLLTLCFRAG